MYKFLLCVLFSLCLLPLEGYSLALPSVEEETPITNILFSGEQTPSAKLRVSLEFGEANQIQTSNFYESGANSKVIAVERQETEEDTRHYVYFISLKKIQNAYFKNFILLANFVLKVRFREFSKSLFLFSESFRLHLFLKVFIV